MLRTLKGGLAVAVAVMVGVAGSASAFEPVDTTRFVAGVDEAKMFVHLEALQAIGDKYKNTRASGTPGYRASVNYVRDTLRAAGYEPRTQPFTAQLFSETSPPALARVSPDPKTFAAGTEVATLEFSASGDVTARLQLVGNTDVPPAAQPGSTSGCAAGDFLPVTAGRIALIQRGTCTFLEKVQNARTAGAAAVILFNEGQEGRTEVLNGTLGETVDIPVVGVSYAVGKELFDLARVGGVQMRVAVDSKIDTIDTFNVLADIPGKVKDRTVLVGAHLDSVKEGPGINDNGSGTAALLTIAQELKRQRVQPQNTVRFAFWGAEESGLLGSTYYVDNLSEAATAQIALNLNFDMLGSRNFVRFVYDGDGTLGDAGPAGSDIIEKVFTDFFDARELASAPTEFDGRSDYFAFIGAGIPAGGLFSGAEGVKTAAEAEAFGGKAGAAYDPCYHSACDTIDKVSRASMRQMGKAAAHGVFTFAQTKEDIRVAARQRMAQAKKRMAADTALYRGSKLAR